MSAVAIASLVDTDGLIESAVAALVAGAGLTIAFSLAVYGVSRFADARRGGPSIAGGAAVVIAALGLLASAAAIVAGLVIMLSDRS